MAWRAITLGPAATAARAVQAVREDSLVASAAAAVEMEAQPVVAVGVEMERTAVLAAAVAEVSRREQEDVVPAAAAHQEPMIMGGSPHSAAVAVAARIMVVAVFSAVEGVEAWPTRARKPVPAVVAEVQRWAAQFSSRKAVR